MNNLEANMTIEQNELYQKIQNFSLDKIDSQFNFTQKLAKENNWSMDYTERVIKEYKKFIFLAVSAEHPVSPSEMVDQVWHLHLTYTQSYWQEFCENILGKPLHHQPTNGGEKEKNKFIQWYQNTLNSYESFFGEKPPSDIWQTPEILFNEGFNYQRINTKYNWIIPKFQIEEILNIFYLRWLIVLLSTSGILLISQCLPFISNPLNFNGFDFLLFYIAIIFVGIIVTRICIHYFSSEKSGNYQQIEEECQHLSPCEIALLIPSYRNFIDTVIFSLFQKKYLELSNNEGNNKILLIKISEELIKNIADKQEKLLLEKLIQANEISIRYLYILANQFNSQFNTQKLLLNKGLLLNEVHKVKAKIYSSFIIESIFCLGILKVFVGVLRDKPVGYLIFLLVFLLIFTSRILSIPVRSNYGNRVLKHLRKTLKKVNKSDYNSVEFSRAFALFGYSMLRSHPQFTSLYNLMKKNSFTKNIKGTDVIIYGFDGGCGGGCGGCGGCGG